MKFTQKIMGDTWEFRALKKFPKECRDEPGITYLQKHIVLLKLKDLSLATIIHEVTHILQSYQCLQSTTSITPDDFDEIGAEFGAMYSTKVLVIAISVLLRILEKHKLEISDEDRSLIGDLFELSEVLDILGERLGFDSASS